MAIKALGLEGEIITTPFSYIATTSSIIWEGCSPVFVDIDPYSLNIDSRKIESAITEKTSGILATHVYGNPCDIEAIEAIAKKHNLKVIYDAAHCFGTTYKGKSVFEYGDISTTSFHATKLFHTVEGGAVFSNKPELIVKMRFMRNFGHDGPGKYNGVGINGKNSEFHAAMGLCNLNYIDEVLETRKGQCIIYDEYFTDSEVLTSIQIQDHTEWNYAYYPIIFESESLLLKSLVAMEKKDIFPRRYFYPSLTDLDFVNGETPISDDLSKRVLCLPLYHTLSVEEQESVASTLLGSL